MCTSLTGIRRRSFQCMWNTCWPRLRKRGWLPSLIHFFGNLKVRFDARRRRRFFEAWLQAKESHTPGFTWLRSEFAPTMLLESGLLCCYRGHADRINGLAASRDGTTVVSASDDLTLGVWERSTGKLRLSLKPKPTAATCFPACTANGSHVAAIGAPQRGYLLPAGCALYRLGRHDRLADGPCPLGRAVCFTRIHTSRRRDCGCRSLSL